MPCRCDYMETPNEDQGLRREVDKATRAACDMRTILRRHNLLGELTQETLKWVHQHDKEDEKRIAEENAKGIREAARKRGLDKLTLEERRALGL